MSSLRIQTKEEEANVACCCMVELVMALILVLVLGRLARLQRLNTDHIQDEPGPSDAGEGYLTFPAASGAFPDLAALRRWFHSVFQVTRHLLQGGLPGSAESRTKENVSGLYGYRPGQAARWCEEGGGMGFLEDKQTTLMDGCNADRRRAQGSAFQRKLKGRSVDRMVVSRLVPWPSSTPIVNRVPNQVGQTPSLRH